MEKKDIKGEPAVILLVEDNQAHAELAIRNLEESRVANKVVHLANGEAALDYLFHRGDYADASMSPRPHLILLDLRLPKIDGLEVLKEIRNSELNGIPVVILSSSEADVDLKKAYKLGASSYLVKPVDFDKFAKLMDDIGYYWLCWNKYPG